jgi:predicted transcriptional regulator
MTMRDTRFARLPEAVKDTLRGTSKRRRCARLLLEALSDDPLTTMDLSLLTGFDRDDVRNALRVLEDAGLARRAVSHRGAWLVNPHA